MKNLVLFAFTVFALNSFASEIDCQKKGAKVTMDKKNVTIEASQIALNDDLRDVVARMTGNSEQNAKTNLSVKITFPRKGLKCSTGMPKVFNCSGSTKKASVEVIVSQQSMFGSSNMQNMQKPVKLENIDISANVGAQGPISLGDAPVTINLDQVMVKSSMIVKMMGDFQLDLDQTFSSQECK